MNNTAYSAKVRLVSVGSGNLKAYATLVVNDIVAIEGFKVLESKAGQLFVGPPSHKGKAADGTETYFNDVRFLEDVAEGEFRGPEAEAAMNAILIEYGRQIATTSTQKAGKAHERRADPDGKRPATPGKGRTGRDVADW